MKRKMMQNIMRNIRTRMSKFVALVFVLALCLSMSGITAFALEQAEVKIPVSATGADCTAAIYDANGTELKTLALKDGESKAFDVTCTDLGSHTYTIKLTDKDTSTVTYDKTVYKVNVELYYRDNGTIGYSISADPLGVLGDNGKPEKLEFKNVKKGTEGGGGTTPTPGGNTPIPGIGDPPVKVEKRIEGQPEKDAEFVFVMKPKNPAYPLQADAVNGETTVSIIGEGEEEFGNIIFTAAGTYEYTVAEKNTGEPGWTYDETVYTVRYVVTAVNGRLVSTRTIYKGEEVVESMRTQALVFTNKYEDGTTPGGPGTQPGGPGTTPGGDTPGGNTTGGPGTQPGDPGTTPGGDTPGGNTPGGPGTTPGGDTPGSNAPGSNTGKTPFFPLNTGDGNNILMPIGIFTTAFVLLLLLLFRRKKGKSA